MLGALEDNVKFEKVRMDRTPYLAGGIGTLASEICIPKDKMSRVTRPLLLSKIITSVECVMILKGYLQKMLDRDRKV